MKALKKIYKFFSFEAKEPKTFGIFHIVFAVIIGFLTTLLCKKCEKTSEKTERKIALYAWIGYITLELYKQIIYSISLDGEQFIFGISWADFPFQLCSTPLYVLPFIAFLPSGRIREAFVAFFGTFTFLGGFAVCIYPGNVFVETLGINLQTIIWHGGQVILGAYFNLRRFASKNPPKKTKYFVSAVPIFLLFTALAIILNVTVQGALDAAMLDEKFNMFFISPYFECMLPILSTIKIYAPYPVFILAYVLGVGALSFALLSSEALIVEKTLEFRKKKAAHKASSEQYINSDSKSNL